MFSTGALVRGGWCWTGWGGRGRGGVGIGSAGALGAERSGGGRWSPVYVNDHCRDVGGVAGGRDLQEVEFGINGGPGFVCVRRDVEGGNGEGDGALSVESGPFSEGVADCRRDAGATAKGDEEGGGRLFSQGGEGLMIDPARRGPLRWGEVAVMLSGDGKCRW